MWCSSMGTYSSADMDLYDLTRHDLSTTILMALRHLRLERVSN